MYQLRIYEYDYITSVVILIIRVLIKYLIITIKAIKLKQYLAIIIEDKDSYYTHSPYKM